MEKKIITISREFGSGGRTMGRKIAEKLGIPFYDKELVDQIAVESGFAPKFVEEHGEHSPTGSFFSYAFAPQGVPGIMNGLSTADFLWNIQCSVILQLAEQYAAIAAKGSKAYVVLQSNPTRLAEQITPDALPFEIICDPEMKLYQELDIRPAASMAKMASFGMIPKIIRASVRKFTHGAYEGNEQQLPAVFVLDREGRITYAHYARHVTDIPSPEALAELMK